MRDQFARLLDDRYEGLRQAGAVLFGMRDLNEKVPPLYSGTRATVAEESGEEGADEGEPEGDADGADEG